MVLIALFNGDKTKINQLSTVQLLSKTNGNSLNGNER